MSGLVRKRICDLEMHSSSHLPETGYGDFDVGKGNGGDHDVRISLVKEVSCLDVMR